MAEQKNGKRVPVLDPIERVSEIIFGLIMVLSFTGSLSVATAGRDEIHTVLFAALGSNLAWGLVDAVMYLVGTLAERTRKLTLVRRVRSTATPREAQAILADALERHLGAVPGAEVLEVMCQRLNALPELPARAHIGRDDLLGALGVFLVVVLATLPVVVPFMLFNETALAMRVSNAVALVTLFAAGYMLGRHAGFVPLRSGLAMAAIGVVLVAVTIALGG